jgi:hypothetical protein
MSERDYSKSLLNQFSCGIDYDWFSRPPRGRFGGILLGICSNTMGILSCLNGEYHINLHIRYKALVGKPL